MALTEAAQVVSGFSVATTTDERGRRLVTDLGDGRGLLEDATMVFGLPIGGGGGPSGGPYIPTFRPRRGR